MGYLEIGQVTPFNVPSSMDLLENEGEGSLGQVQPFEDPEDLDEGGYGTLADVPVANIGFTKQGTAYGIGAPTHEIFKDLQAQANRLAGARGMSQIGVDGKIGKKTLTLVEAGLRQSVGDIARLASLADVFAASLRAEADRMGSPPPRKPRPPSTPPKAGKPGGPPLPPGAPLPDDDDEGGVMGFITSPLGLGVLGIGALLLLTGGGKQVKKRRKRRKAKSRTTTVRY